VNCRLNCGAGVVSVDSIKGRRKKVKKESTILLIHALAYTITLCMWDKSGRRSVKVDQGTAKLLKCIIT